MWPTYLTLRQSDSHIVVVDGFEFTSMTEGHDLFFYQCTESVFGTWASSIEWINCSTLRFGAFPQGMLCEFGCFPWLSRNLSRIVWSRSGRTSRWRCVIVETPPLGKCALPSSYWSSEKYFDVYETDLPIEDELLESVDHQIRAKSNLDDDISKLFVALVTSGNLMRDQEICSYHLWQQGCTIKQQYEQKNGFKEIV